MLSQDLFRENFDSKTRNKNPILRWDRNWVVMTFSKVTFIIVSSFSEWTDIRCLTLKCSVTECVAREPCGWSNKIKYKNQTK